MLTITNEDNMLLMARLKNESIDIICIDPPYKYLKNQKLDIDFDEIEFFTEAKRVLSKDGFIIMFGRGVSFYRMNCIIADLGFTFKEEIVWNKNHSSSPLMAIMRVHETISILSKGKGVINKVKIPYIEMKNNNFDGIIRDIKRLKSSFKNTDSLNSVIKYLEDNVIINVDVAYRSTTVTSEKIGKPNRCVSVVKSIQEGMVEKTIISAVRNHYGAIHPTEKPVRLIERLISLCLPNKPKEQIIVADFFGGSMSTMEACINLGVNGISCEIDKEYFDKAMERINNHLAQQKLF